MWRERSMGKQKSERQDQSLAANGRTISDTQLRVIRHLSVDERVAIGRTARVKTPRERHAAWEPSSDRPDPIALLE